MKSKRKADADPVEPFDRRIQRIRYVEIDTMNQLVRCHETLNHALQSLFNVDLIKRKVQAYLEYRSKENDPADEEDKNVLVGDYEGFDYQIAQDILNGFRTWLNQSEHIYWDDNHDSAINGMSGFIMLNPPEIEWKYAQFYDLLAPVSSMILDDILEFIFIVLTEMRENGEVFSYPAESFHLYQGQPVLIYKAIPPYVWFQSVLRQQPEVINNLNKLNTHGAFNLAKNLSKQIKF